MTELETRVALLEAHYQRLAKMEEQVNDMHAILNQAQGAKWAVLTAIGVGSWLAASGVAVAAWFRA